MEAKAEVAQGVSKAREQRVELAAGVYVLNEKDELLLVTGPKFTNWVVPGGHVEFGEGLEACARRELFEETGLRSRNLSYLGTVEAKRMKVAGRARHFVFVDYACRLKSPKVKLQARELNECLWLPLDKAAKEPAVASSVKSLLPQLKKLAGKMTGNG